MRNTDDHPSDTLDRLKGRFEPWRGAAYDWLDSMEDSHVLVTESMAHGLLEFGDDLDEVVEGIKRWVAAHAPPRANGAKPLQAKVQNHINDIGHSLDDLEESLRKLKHSYDRHGQQIYDAVTDHECASSASEEGGGK